MPIHLVPPQRAFLTRLALVAAACIALSGLAGLALGVWQIAQNGQQKRDLPPILTAHNHGLTYAPGETVLLLAEGFQPYEPLFTRLRHHSRGLLWAAQSQADAQGRALAAQPLSLYGEAEATPPGRLAFEVSGLYSGSQAYPFRLGRAATHRPPAKGVHPPSAIPGGRLALWCSGGKPGRAPLADIAVDGTPLPETTKRLTVYPTAPDGLLLAALQILPGDPAGDWTVFLGACELHISIGQPLSLSTRLTDPLSYCPTDPLTC